MALFEWKDNYSVGSKSIDNQHKKLIQFINEFYENITIKSNKELISALIKEMKEYTVFHFNYEEVYLEKLGFKEMEEHKLEHVKFIEKVNNFEARFNSKKIILSYEITSFLKNWLKHHILIEDMKYSHCIKEYKSNGSTLSNKSLITIPV